VQGRDRDVSRENDGGRVRVQGWETGRKKYQSCP
jgi:hypothetical protein